MAQHHFIPKQFTTILIGLLVTTVVTGQVKWDGEAGDGQWNSAANWAGNVLPVATDHVLLDNSMVTGQYNVSLPGLSASVEIQTLTIAPLAGNRIQLMLPASNTASPALAVTGPGYGIRLLRGAVLINASGTTSAAAISVADSLQINNGGEYVHQTRSSHAALVTGLSRMPGTETGIFTFDAPGSSYTFATTGRTYGTLVLSAAASGGSQVYATSAASPLVVNGDFIIRPGVTVNFNTTAPISIHGDYVQEGGVCNLASQANNNSMHIKRHFLQTAGSIIETAGGEPVLAFTGTISQRITATGVISNKVAVQINNPAGVVLQSGLSLPHHLNLVSGIVHTQLHTLILLGNCNLTADSLAAGCFVDGRLRKEGLSASSHFLFPVGKGITQRWLALKNATGHFTVEFFKASPALLSANMGAGVHHTSSIEYYSVQADAVPAPSATVELSFNDVNSGGVTDLTALRVARLVNGTWVDGGNSATTGTAGSAGSVSSQSLNAFTTTDFFTLASSNAFQNPLPLNQFAFTVRPTGETGLLASWQTEPGWQAAYFELQVSLDGIRFSTFATIPAGTQQAYQYIHDYCPVGTQFYRLTLVDQHGGVWHSAKQRLTVHHTPVQPMTLLPSLVHANAWLITHSAAAQPVLITVYDIQGRVLIQRHDVLQQGANHLLMPLQQLVAGAYSVRVTTGNRVLGQVRFIKQ